MVERKLVLPWTILDGVDFEAQRYLYPAAVSSIYILILASRCFDNPQFILTNAFKFTIGIDTRTEI